jgi:hypothetical protein
MIDPVSLLMARKVLAQLVAAAVRQVEAESELKRMFVLL